MWRIPSPSQLEGSLDAGAFKRTGLMNNKSIYYTSPVTCTALTPQTLQPDILTVGPLIVPKNVVVDQIGIRVITPGTATLCRLGIYGDNGNVFPRRLILDAGTVDVRTAGLCLQNVSQKLTPGLHYVGAVLNGTSSVITAHYNYHVNVLGYNATSYNQGYSRIDAPFPFTNGPLPDPFPASGNYLCGPIFLVFVRFAA